jgi:hypothetical protein
LLLSARRGFDLAVTICHSAAETSSFSVLKADSHPVLRGVLPPARPGLLKLQRASKNSKKSRCMLIFPVNISLFYMKKESACPELFWKTFYTIMPLLNPTWDMCS